MGSLNQVLIIRQAMFGLVSARSAPAGRQERASCGVHLPLNNHREREGKRRRRRSVAAAYPGVTVPYDWTWRGRWRSIIPIRVIRPRCDCAPDDGAGYGPGCHSAPKRTWAPAPPPRICGTQRCQCRRADDCHSDENVLNLSHAITQPKRICTPRSITKAELRDDE